MGLQKKASLYAIASYWLISIPLACVLSLTLGYGVIGLWYGIVVAVAL